jgi:hypothetical protein
MRERRREQHAPAPAGTPQHEIIDRNLRAAAAEVLRS